MESKMKMLVGTFNKFTRMYFLKNLREANCAIFVVAY